MRSVKLLAERCVQFPVCRFADPFNVSLALVDPVVRYLFDRQLFDPDAAIGEDGFELILLVVFPKPVNRGRRRRSQVIPEITIQFLLSCLIVGSAQFNQGHQNVRDKIQRQGTVTPYPVFVRLAYHADEFIGGDASRNLDADVEGFFQIAFLAELLPQPDASFNVPSFRPQVFDAVVGFRGKRAVTGLVVKMRKMVLEFHLLPFRVRGFVGNHIFCTGQAFGTSVVISPVVGFNFKKIVSGDDAFFSTEPSVFRHNDSSLSEGFRRIVSQIRQTILKARPVRVAALLAYCLLCVLPLQARADFSTAEVAEASANPVCVDWKIKGICLKLKCSFFGCYIKTVPWITHRLPDLVVSAYNTFGDVPWTEARAIYGELAGAAASAAIKGIMGVAPGGASSNPNRGAGSEGRSNIRFKEINIAGNPALAAFRRDIAELADFDFLCPTEVTPMGLYFSSELDGAAWRTGLTEQLYPATWAPGLRPIGKWPHRYWGGVYPRHGHVQQEYDSLAGAVMAQRAVDIVTRSAQPHIYNDVPGVPKSDEKTDQWQMIFPRAETQCITFGEDRNYHAGRESGSGPDEGDYGWIYWPLHECCPGSGKTIAKIGF